MTGKPRVDRSHPQKNSRSGPLNAANYVGVKSDLRSILKEIRVITDKIRAEVILYYDVHVK